MILSTYVTYGVIEQTEIMRQKDDQTYTEIWNKFRTGTQTEADIHCIQSRSISSSDFNYIHMMLFGQKMNLLMNTMQGANHFTLGGVGDFEKNYSLSEYA